MIADDIFAVFAARGANAYVGESISVTEHVRQAAHFARASGAPSALVLAALLHDVGHLIDAVSDDLTEWVDDARHEESGAHWLAARFAAPVYEPVRLHVPAKRYLCATEPRYLSQLSAASRHTLALQGGPMQATEAAAFETQPFHRDAIRLRRWDDAGKIVGLATPDLASYRPLIQALALPRRVSA